MMLPVFVNNVGNGPFLPVRLKLIGYTCTD